MIPKGFIRAFRNGFAPVKIFVVLNTTSPTIWERPQIVALEKRLVKANSSMVASTFYKSPVYHGNRDAYAIVEIVTVF